MDKALKEKIAEIVISNEMCYCLKWSALEGKCVATPDYKECAKTDAIILKSWQRRK